MGQRVQIQVLECDLMINSEAADTVVACLLSLSIADLIADSASELHVNAPLWADAMVGAFRTANIPRCTAMGIRG